MKALYGDGSLSRAAVIGLVSSALSFNAGYLELGTIQASRDSSKRLVDQVWG